MSAEESLLPHTGREFENAVGQESPKKALLRVIDMVYEEVCPRWRENWKVDHLSRGHLEFEVVRTWGEATAGLGHGGLDVEFFARIRVIAVRNRGEER